MSTPLLATKLYVPPPRPNAVPRARLIARLNAGLHRKLTLIAAPAGFGKTTLVSTWAASLSSEFSVLSSELASCAQLKTQNSKLKTSVVWLSLEEADSDPIRFLTYLIAALQTIAPTIGVGLLGVLQSPQPPPAEAILTALLNEITAVPDYVVLVLDDYHVIDAQPIDDALIFLLEHLPPNMHLVIATREDPQLPLARLRVRDQMTELRAADLRFTAAEAAAFLSQVMDLDLAAEHVSALETRTEGWIAGLQLAALSLRGRTDVSQFVKAFAGDNRYIVDYLVEEVLQRQPEHVRSFLLQTAILDRLSGPLCDAILDEGRKTKDESSISFVLRPSSLVLEELERGNFFVVPLDDNRHWYRYHHLFAEVLAAHLRAEQPDLIPLLHQRASVWYEHNGSAADAIRHALAAQDFARAADLVELAIPAMRRTRQEATMLGWLTALPDEVIRCRPVLSAVYASALLSSGQLDGVEARLRDAERWLDTPTAAMIVVDEAAFRLLPGLIAMFRAGQALVLGDVAGTVTYAQRALDLVPEDDHLTHGAATALLGLASWASGDLVAAHRAYADGMAHVQRAGFLSDTISGTVARADKRIAQGHLREAMSTYEQALQLAAEQDEQFLRGTADLYVGMSELQYEHNDLPAATQHLLRSKEVGERTGFPQNRSRWCVAMARIQQAEGDLDGALDLLDEAERLYVSDFFPNVRPVAALKARLWVAQGRLGEARGWAREQSLSAQDDLGYLREFEHVTLARLLLAQYKRDDADASILEAIGLLERLLNAAQAGERTGSVIEILLLQALAHRMHGDIPVALVPFSRALALAEPEGYIRMFVDAGPAMKLLIADCKLQIARSAHGEGNRHTDTLLAYIDMLLGAFPRTEDRGLRTEFAESPHSVLSPQPSPLVEPLSVRELDVLRLLRTDLSGPQIARELMVSLHTLRTHTNNIYTKLGMNNRRAAVRRAEELGLF